MHPLELQVMTWSGSLFGAATLVACVAYGLIVPAAFHASPLLEQLLPGFRWLTPGASGSGSSSPWSTARTRAPSSASFTTRCSGGLDDRPQQVLAAVGVGALVGVGVWMDGMRSLTS